MNNEVQLQRTGLVKEQLVLVVAANENYSRRVNLDGLIHNISSLFFSYINLRL